MRIILRVFADYTAMAECNFISKFSIDDRLFVGDNIELNGADYIVKSVKLVILEPDKGQLFIDAILDKPLEYIEKEVD